MKKFTRLLLIAMLCLPWVTQAQGDCTPISTFPVTYGFEASEGFTTTVTAATACTTNVFTNCWRNEQTTFNGSTGSGRIWHIYGGTTATYLHSGAHSLMLPDKGSTTAGVSTTMLTFPAMNFTNPGGYIVTFWIQRNGTSTNPEGFKIYVSDTDTIGPNAVELGHYSRNRGIAYPCIESATGWYQYETAPITMTGTVYIIFEGQSYYGSSTYVDDITIMEAPTCFKVSDLAVNASQTTTNSLTLTWNDTINSGATYSIYSFTATDTTLVQSGVTGTTYTVSGLNAATLYTFAVVTDCGGGDTSMYSSIVSAYTACAALTADDLPYMENFENYLSGSANPINPCWTKGTNTSTAYPYPYSTAGINSSMGLYFYGYYPSSATGTHIYSWAALPPIDNDLDMSDLMLTLDVKRYSTVSNYYTTLLYIGVADSVTGFNSATAIESNVTWIDTLDYFSSAASSIHNAEVSFDQYVGTGKYVVLYAPTPELVGSSTYAYNYVYVDNVVLRAIPTCFWPTSATVVSTSIDEAELSWTPDPRTSNPSSWTVEYGEHGFTPGEGDIVTVYDTTVSLTNLDANTVYDAYISANCGSETSDATMITFRTLCTLLDSLPYSYGFDDLATGSSTVRPTIPCWQHLNNGTTYFGWPYVSSTNHTGGRSLYWYGSTTTGTYGDYQIVVLPGVDTNIYPINTLQLNFWARPSSTSYSPVFQVGVMSNPTDASTFQNVQTVDVQNVTTWQEFTVMFGNYTGSGQYIAVRMNRPSSTLYAYTDDFTLSEMPTCAPVVSHHVTTTAGSARITWTRDQGFASDPNGYEVNYGLASDNLVGATSVTTTEPVLDITGLDPDSTYMVSIAPVCTGINGDAVTFTFTTQGLPCLEWDTSATGGGSSPAATYVVGTPGTTTTNVMPVNGGYNYSYCNHLIRHSDMASIPSGTTYISGIDFQYAATTPMVSKTNCTIYMCHTTMTTCDNFANPSDLVLVYEGPLNCTTQGWNHFEFNRGTFAYNGTSNIMVAIVDNSGATDANESFYYEAPGVSVSHRVYRNDSPYTFADLGTVTASNSVWRTNMRLTTGGSGGGDCLTSASCAAPAVSIEQENTGNYLLSWIPGYQETSWDVDYRITGSSTWTSVVSGTSNTDYTFLSTDLQSNTHYEFRVTALCSDTNIATTLAYTTPCGMIATVPFTENFDTYGAGTTVFPSCWYKLGSTADRPYINSSTTYGHNNTYGLYFYAAATGYCYAIMPRVNTTILNLNTLQVSFWARQYSTSYNCDFEVGVMTDPTNASTFTAISSVHPAGTTYESFEVPLSSYTGTGSYIAFRAIQHPGSSTAIYMMLDDVTLENAPSCPRVTNVQADNITQNDATISWTATNANEYEVQYGPADFTLGTGAIEIGITDDSVVLTGLTANTPYDVYVRGICTDDTSNWSFVYTFRTACGILDSLPFTEDFENQPTGTSSTGSPFIPCWTRLNNGTSYPGYPYVSSSSTYNHTQGGTKGLYWYGSTTTGTYGDYQYIILPQIDTTVYPINTLQLGFWAKASSTSYHPVLQVGVMNSTTDTAMTVLATINVNPGSSTEWGEFITSLSEYTGSGSYVAIRALRPSSTWYVYVDDITLELLPPCPRVEELHAINATLDSITIVWTDTSSTNNSWVVEYDTVDFTPGAGTATSFTVTDTIFNLSGLDSAHTYHIYVYPVCDDYIGYRHITAATLAASPATVPYTCDFEENGPNGWDFLNDGQTNYWMVGTDAHNGGTQSMYITNNGTSNAYNTSTISYSYAIRTFNFSEPGEYAYSYDWKGVGESHNYDFTRVFVTPASEMFTAGDVLGGSTYNFANAAAPANWIELTQSGETPNTLAQQSTWTTVTGTFTITTPGNYKMVFVWANDGSGGTQPPTAIDNVSLIQNVCPSVDDLNLAYVTIDSAIVTWNSFAEQTGYIFEYDSVPFTPGNATNVFALTDTFYVMTGLTAGMTYYVSVRAECTGDTALAATMHFTTLASLPATVPYSCDFEQSGVNGWDFINGTQGNYWIVGSATNNGGTQSMYITDNGTANNYSGSESYVFATRTFNLAAGNYICSYDWKCNGESSFDFLRVALVPAGTQLTAGEYSGFDNESAMPVGGIALDGGYRMNLQTSWNTEVTEFTLTTAGSYKMVFMWRNDGSVYNQPPAAIDNVQLMLNNCPMPLNITATTLTQTSADLSWEEPGTATEWEYQLGSNAPVIVNDTFCTVTGLAANTGYTFRVRSICGQGDTSMWASYTFRTPCGYLTLPYIEDFETYGTGTTAFPSCWYKIGSTADRPYVYATTSYGHNNSHPLYFYAVATGYCYAVMPPVDPTLSLSTLQVSFWARQYSTSYNCDFVVGVMTDPTNVSTFTAIDTVHPAGTTYEQFDVPLLSYTGTGNYIAFSAVQHPGSSTAIYMMLDDVVLEPVPTCLTPHNLHATASTTSSITIDWTDLSATSQWEIEYSGNGVTTTTQVSTHPYTLNNLPSSTAYSIRVRAICSVGDTSHWTMAENAATECGLVSLPYVEGFENYTGTTYSTAGVLPVCWDGYSSINTAAYFPHITGSGSYWYPHSGSNVLTMTSGSSTYGDTKIVVLPTFDQPMNTLSMTFWYRMENATNGSTLYVGYVTGPGYDTSFVPLKTVTSTTTLTFDSISFDTVPATATNIAFKWYYNTSFYSVGIDDIEVTSSGVYCTTPTVLPATDVTYNSATVNWSSNATAFEVAVKAANEGTWPAETTVNNTTSFNFTGLQPETQYQFRVRAICDATENIISDWAEGTFTTDDLPCFAPTDVTATPAYDAVTVNWTPGTSETLWNVHVWNSGMDTVVVVGARPAVIGGLVQTTAYNVAVQALCGGGATESDYSDTVSFTTLTCAPVSGVSVSNVTSSSATVTWNGTAQSYDIEYGDHGFGQGQGTKVNGVTGQTYTINGLDPEAQYDVYVRANCDANNTSDWSPVVSFTTTQPEGINTADGMNVTIFPNPTSTSTTISLSGVSGDVQISIVDMNGRTVMNETMSCDGTCTKQMEVSGLASGAYFVRVSGEGVNMVKKLVVK